MKALPALVLLFLVATVFSLLLFAASLIEKVRVDVGFARTQISQARTEIKAAQATIRPAGTLVPGTPESSPFSSEYTYRGKLGLYQTLVSDGVEFTFFPSSEGILMVNRRLEGRYKIDFLGGGYGYNDIQFMPTKMGIDVWGKKGVSGFVDQNAEKPACVGVFDGKPFAMDAGDLLSQIFYPRQRNDLICQPNGSLLVYREEIPVVCQTSGATIHYANPQQQGYCDLDGKELARWNYPTPQVIPAQK